MEGGARLRNVILYYLVRAIRELGVSLPLLFRRVSTLAGKEVDYWSKTFLQGKIDVNNFESVVNGIAEIMKNEGLVKDIKIAKLGTDEVSMEVSGCEYLPMVSEARGKGEKECPLCLVALIGAMAAGAGNVSVNDVETKTDLDSGTCKVTLRFVKV